MARTQMNIETTWVARFLESERAIADIEQDVALWREMDLPIEKLADALRQAVEKVDGRARQNGHPQVIELREVDWIGLAERYAEMFNG